MQIKSIKISNCFNFPYIEDFDNAPFMEFDQKNIIIGANGCGKTNLLRVIQIYLKDVIFLNNSFVINRDLKLGREVLIPGIININDPYKLNSLLSRNWSYPDKDIKVSLMVEIENSDFENIQTIKNIFNSELGKVISNINPIFNSDQNYQTTINNLTSLYQIWKDVDIDSLKIFNKFEIVIESKLNETPIIHILKDGLKNDVSNLLFEYLKDFNTLSSVVSFLGAELLRFQFALISDSKDFDWPVTTDLNAGIENVNMSEGNSATLLNQIAIDILNKHRMLRYSGMINTFDDTEFAKHINHINLKLKEINCTIEIEYPINERPNDFNSGRLKLLKNEINISNNFKTSLSKGEKNFLLIALASSYFGNEGLIILDEPENNLHKQLIDSVLKLVDTSQCQYLISTHSERVIEKNTLQYIKRLSNYEFKKIDPDSNNTSLLALIKGLRESVFYNNLIFVEGETDRIFFEWFINKFYSDYANKVFIIDIGSKNNYTTFNNFFIQIGIKTYFIGDLDNLIENKSLSKISQEIKCIFDKAKYIKDNYYAEYLETCKKSIDKIKFTNSVFFELMNEFSNRIHTGRFMLDINYLSRIENSWNELIDKNISKSGFVNFLKSNYTNDFNQICKIAHELINSNIYLLSGDLEDFTSIKKSVGEMYSALELLDNEELENIISIKPEFTHIKNLFNDLFQTII
ncbi:MAG: hypothetical protein OHK0017_08740 [Patescibacteria group bacterium]